MIGDDQTAHVAVRPIDPKVLLYGREDVQPVLGAGVRRGEIVLNQAVGRGIRAAGHSQGGQVDEILVNDVRDELQVEFRRLNRRFTLEIRDQLIAEKGQHPRDQQGKHGHNQDDAAFDGGFSGARVDHLVRK